ncbi:MAG TPA: VWA domain-containing protein [Candidatus Limnocylindrales bacterium]|nr:VWA domain-containing protein [Candidatus Limnocylindrales bacterium]
MRALCLRAMVRVAVMGALAVAGSAGIGAQAPAGPQPTSPGQDNTAPAQKPAAPQQQKPQEAGVSIAVEVPVVTLDVVAATQNGDIIPGLKKENFRVLEDGQPQTITSFGPTDAPITMVVLMEFSARFYGWFGYQAKYWAGALFPNLNQKDWVALVTFDMRPRTEVDFTQNKQEVEQAIYHLYYPGFSESNLFDALLDTNERLKDVKGKKSILVLASGVDTFSKHTLDQTMKQLRGTETTIFVVGLDKPLSNYLEMHRALGTMNRMDFLQAENQMKTFAQMTGGFAWFPQFDGEIPGIMREVAAFLRHQYSISYTPSNPNQDGKFRKIKVELVAPDGGPLEVRDQKGKKQKVVVYTREGYQSVKGGVGD